MEHAGTCVLLREELAYGELERVLVVRGEEDARKGDTEIARPDKLVTFGAVYESRGAVGQS